MNIARHLFATLVITVMTAPTLLYAQGLKDAVPTEQGTGVTGTVANQAGFAVANVPKPFVIIGVFINTLLGAVGVIFMINIIRAGMEWMSAGGNEEQVTKSKQRIVNATIGLAVILAAYAINRFLFALLAYTP